MNIQVGRRLIGQSARILVVVLALAQPVSFAIAREGNEGQEAPADHTPTADLPDVPAPKIDDPVNAAELDDLRTFANQEGMSLQAAIDRYAWNDNFALMVGSLRDETPMAFTGAEIVDGGHAWVAFADGTPVSARGVIRAFQTSHPTVAVEIRSGLGFSQAELEKAITTVHYAILNTSGVRDASTGFDFDTRTITSRLVLDADIHPPPEDLRAGALDSLVVEGMGEILGHVVVSVVESDLPVLFTTDSGTQHLGAEELSGATCTSGFIVYSNDNGIRGQSTAGHCDNQLTDDGIQLTWKAGHEGQHGDYQWHTGPQGDPDDYYAGALNTTETDRRDVAYVTSAVKGQVLCRNGTVSHKDCNEVIRINVCAGSLCNLVQMDDRDSAGGDSGGAVYYTNTAYGLHTGAVWYDGAYRDVFSEAHRMVYALGVGVAK